MKPLSVLISLLATTASVAFASGCASPQTPLQAQARLAKADESWKAT